MSPSCPACGAPLAPVVYGLPDPETMAAAERGELALGGCDPMDSATVTCWRCGTTVELPSGEPGDPAGKNPAGSI